jgi:arylsulfatase A-like enzyme
MAIAHADGRNAGRVVPQSVGTIDLVPTLLAWLEVDVDIDFDGRDLTPLIEGDSAEERPVSTEQFEYFPVRAVRSGPWMLRQAAEPKQSVEDGVISLSRRTQHGGGKRDTIPPEIERQLAEALEESARPSVYHEIERIQIPEPVRAQLRALGYTDEARGPDR